MKIVIDIPEEIYDFVQNTSFVEDENTLFKQKNADRKKTLYLFDIIDAIGNGAPLPEHHGRLIDADALPISHGVFVPRAANEVMLCTPMDAVFADEIKDAPTIIEGSDSE